MVSIMESDFVLFARARGESETSIVLRHGLRNVLIPAMTLQFASISEIIGGSVLVEQVFSLSGTGPGGSDSRTGKRRAPSSGDHSGHGGTGSFREPGGQRSLWNRGSQDPERSGPMSGMKKRENGKRLGNRRLFSMGLFGAFRALFLLLVAVLGMYGRMRHRSRIFQGRTFLPVPDICSALTGWGGICLSVLWRAFP